MSPSRSYSGDPLDLSYQYITERPELEEEAEDVVSATEPEPQGEERAENVPVPDAKEESDAGCAIEPARPDVAGQTTLADWGGGDGTCRRRG